jgi:predicted RNase H-like HicB family nuclease
MKQIYPAIFHEEDGGYWVEFPDLDGCITEGDSREEALEMAEEALGLFLVALEEQGKEIPQPTSIENVSAIDGFVTYIATNMNRYRRNTKAVKKMVSIPEWLSIEAEKNNISLSKVLQESLLAKIQ